MQALIQILSRCLLVRMTPRTFDALKNQIPLESLSDLIQTCGTEIGITPMEKVITLTSLLEAIYADPKDKLIDSRHEYVF